MWKCSSSTRHFCSLLMPTSLSPFMSSLTLTVSPVFKLASASLSCVQSQSGVQLIQGVASPVKWAAVRGLPPSYSFGATFDFRPLLTKAFFVWFQSSKMSLTHCSFTVMLDLPCTEWCRGQSWRLISHSSTEDRKFLCDHLKSRLTMCAKMILWDHS